MSSFDWDEHNVLHIAEHGVAPEEAEQAFCNDPVELNMQESDGEQRLRQVGMTDGGRILVVVTTWRGDRVRVVTAFIASPAYRRFYANQRSKDFATGISEAEIQD